MSDIDDTSSVTALSEAVTETASQPSTLNTRSTAAGSTVFATFRGGRSRSDAKIYVPTEWLHRKKRGRKSPI
ncbi:hypothetical protein B0J13DRAFT_405827, partial [Dactylonectria estremocensis]